MFLCLWHSGIGPFMEAVLDTATTDSFEFRILILVFFSQMARKKELRGILNIGDSPANQINQPIQKQFDFKRQSYGSPGT